ncbi:MAG: class I SAM-dependent methyltransferase [Mariniphaga sp.]|nr:class I SAM-dependent methyltransferase [Mariniphaga sp.]
MYRLYRFTAAKGLPTQLLDYGSGNCLWTTAASVVGFQVTAYEPNIKRIKNIANKNFTIVQQLSELNGNRFDVINLEQVLEHTKDPYELLRGLIPYLKSRSLLRIAVPNIHHHVRNKDIWSMFPFDGAKMHIMSPYEHLHGFTNVSLQLLVKRAGFALDLSLATCRAYPLNTFRTIMGKLIPAISTTECLMRPNSDILGTRP